MKLVLGKSRSSTYLKVLISILLIYPLYYAEAFGEIPGLLIISYVALDLLLLYKVFVFDGGKLKLHFIFKYLFCFYVFALISGLLVAPDIRFFVYKISLAINYTLLSAVVYWICFRDKEYSFAIGLLLIISLLYIVTAIVRGQTVFGRLVVGANANANTLGIMCVICSVVSVFLAGYNRFGYLLAIITIPLSIYASVLSGSRKALLGIIVFIATFTVMTFGTIITKHPIRTLIVLLLLAFAYLLFRETISMFWTNSIILDRFENSSSLNDGRVSLYQDSFAVFLKHPLTGVGFCCYQFYSAYNLYSHSAYMEVLAGTGIVGFCFWISYYVKISTTAINIRRFYGSNYRINWVLAYLVTQILLDFSSVSLETPGYMVLLGFSVAIIQEYTESKEHINDCQRIT